MNLAKEAARRTTCIRRGVGCVLADERGRVLSIGYNGVAAGMPHCNEGVEVGMFSVPERPGPEHWEVPAAFYLERGFNLHPGMRSIYTVPVSVRPSTVKGEVGVVGCRYHHACEGYNLPPGQDNCEALHAEQNALVQCPDADRILTAYVTLSPCKACTKLLLGTGCRRIVFLEAHTDLEPMALWQRSGRTFEHTAGQPGSPRSRPNS